MRKRIAFGLVAGLAALAAGASTTAPASAAAIVIRDTITTPFTESGVPNDCRPDVTGSLEGTDVLDFQSVETEEGFHVTGTVTDSGRIDWSDGTLASQSSPNTFSAEGGFLYGFTFHLVRHVTVTNGDVIRVEFERGRTVHTVGDC